MVIDATSLGANFSTKLSQKHVKWLQMMSEIWSGFILNGHSLYDHWSMHEI